MELIVVRHGETRFNREKRYLGALDPPLTERGLAQARSLREGLPPVGAILSSPLLRARQTAALLCPEGQAFVCADAFRERHVGVFEGLTQDEARTLHPALWARQITRHWNDAPPGGESIAAVAARVGAGLLAIAAPGQAEPVLLVAHGFVAKIVRALCGAGFADFFDWQLDNGAMLHTPLDPAAVRAALARAPAGLPPP